MKKLYEEDSIQDIADAIREKGGSTDTYTVAQMAPAIRALSMGDLIVSNTWKVPEDWLTNTSTGAMFHGKYVTLYGTSRNITIDWGDGSTTVTNSSSGTTYSHQYSQYGSYIIKHNGDYNDIYYSASQKFTALLNPNRTSVLHSGSSTAYLIGFFTPIVIVNTTGTFSSYYYSNIGPNIVTIINLNSCLTLSDSDGILAEYVYVPDTLVSSYQSATNWCNFYDHIYPISQCPYIDWNS